MPSFFQVLSLDNLDNLILKLSLETQLGLKVSGRFNLNDLFKKRGLVIR